MWPRTNLLDLLGITHPILQAPMAGATTPQLAAATSNAGALGSLGFASSTVETIREQVAATRQATNHSFNINFFVHPEPSHDAAAGERMRQRLSRYYDELGLGPVPPVANHYPLFDEERLELVLELRPPVASFHFGLPEPRAVRRLKEAGCIILSSATTVAEARRLEAEGADAIIAQGFEAGGHRGHFIDAPGAGMVGTMALVPQVVDAVSVPVIAAGGIMDGRGIAAAFALGASGAQLGTAFLGCPEAAVAPHHRAALREASDADTQLTTAFTGRPARGIRNRFVAEMEDEQALAFPLQGSLTAPFRKLAGHVAAADFSPLWSGQAVTLLRHLPAAELVEALVAETQAALR